MPVGVRWELVATFPRKESAQRAAAELRRAGMSARVQAAKERDPARRRLLEHGLVEGRQGRVTSADFLACLLRAKELGSRR
jgi:Fe2+ transport system protein FeoA